MSAEGILRRGKENYEAGAFLNNPETLAYIDSLPKEKPKEEKKKNGR